MTAPMALRTSSIPSSSATPAAPADWRGRVELAITVAAARLTAGDLDGLAAVFADVSGWDDRQRAYQARCRLAECVLAYRPDTDAWVGAFVAAAACLSDALEQEPREPVLLNYAGVLLYELSEAGAAAELFRAALPARSRAPHMPREPRSGPPARAAPRRRLPGVHAARTRGLAARGRRIAARARAVKDLTLSLCMIVKNEEEMLPGCLEAAARRRRRDRRRRHRLDRPHRRDRRVVRRDGRPLPVERLVRRRAQRLARGRDRRLGHVPRRRRAPRPRGRPRGCARCSAARGARASTSSRRTTPAATSPAPPSPTSRCAIWRNRPEYRFEGRIHEQKTQPMPTYLPERFETTRIRMRHYGYLKSRIAREGEVAPQHRAARAGGAGGADARSPTSTSAPSTWCSASAARRATHFDRRVGALRRAGGWQSVGYAPMLVSRAWPAPAARPATRRRAHARSTRASRAFPDHTDLVLRARRSAPASERRPRRRAARARRALPRDGRRAGRVRRRRSAPGTYLALCLLAEIARRAGRRARRAEELYRRTLARAPGLRRARAAARDALLAPRREPAEVARARAARRGRAPRCSPATACYEAGHAARGRGAGSGDVLERQPGERRRPHRARRDAARASAATPRRPRRPRASRADSPVAAPCRRALLFAHAVLRRR